MAIKHAYQSATANDGTKEVSSTRWNEAHTIEDGTITRAQIAAAFENDLAALEAADVTLAGDILTLDGRLDTAEADIAALEAADVALAGDISDLDGRVTALEAASHAAVTLAGTPDYITLSGQQITRALINLASHVTGDLPFANIAQIATNRLLGRATAATGDIEEISLGTRLSFSGTTLNAAATKPFLQWTALGNQPPASAYATLDTRNSHAVLDFDGSTDEEAIFGGVLSPDYAGGGLTCELYVAFTSATSGSVRFQAAIERIDASSLDIDSDSFASFQSAGGTAPGTSGQVIKITITFTAGAQMDSLAAGEAFRLKIRRDADGTSGTDDITSDAELLRVVLRET